MINYRKALVHDLSLTPYNPVLYIDLCRVDSKLGFCDIALANAHRGLILIQAAIGMAYNPRFGPSVRRVVSQKLRTTSPLVIDEELWDLHIKMYREFLNGFLGTAAFW